MTSPTCREWAVELLKTFDETVTERSLLEREPTVRREEEERMAPPRLLT